MPVRGLGVESETPDQCSFRAIVESISDGVFAAGHDWVIASPNRAAERVTGVCAWPAWTR